MARATTKVRGMTIHLGADASELQKAFENIRTKCNQTKKALRDVNNLLKFDTTSPVLLGQKQRYLASEIQTTTDKLKTERAMLKKLSEGGNTDKIVEEQAAIERQIEADRQALKQFIDEFGRLQSVGAAELTALGNKMTEVGEKMKAMGRSMTMYVTTPIVAGATAAVKAASDVESSMQKVRTILTANGDAEILTYADQLEQVTEASNETGIAMTDYNEALYWTLSASVKAADAIGFTTNAIKLSRGGFTDTETAVDLLTTVMNAYGEEAGSVEEIMDDLITTQNRGKTTVDLLAGSLGRVIPNAKNYGVSFEQVSAAMADLTKKGTNTRLASTGLVTMINELAKSSSGAGKQLNSLTGKSFKEMMDSGSSLADVLQVLAEGASESGKTLGDMFSNTRSRTAALTLMSDAGASFSTILAEMGDNAGAAQSAFEEMDATPAVKMQKAINKLKNVVVNIGYDLIPTVNEFSEKLGEVWDAYKKLTPQQKKTIKYMLAMAAAAGPLLTVGGNILTISGKLITGGTKLVSMMGRLEEAERMAAAGGVKLTGGMKALSIAMNPATIVAATVAITGALGAYAIFADDIKKANIKKEIRETSDSFRNQTADIEATAAQAESLKNRIAELQKKEELTAEEQDEMRVSVARLNAAYPDLGLTIDDTTGKVADWNEEVETSIDNMIRAAKIEKYKEQIEDLADAVADAEIAYGKANDKVDEYNQKIEDLGEAYKKGQISQFEYETTLEELKVGLNKAQQSANVYDTAVNDLTQQLTDATGTLEEYEGAAEGAADASNEASGAVGSLQASFENLSEVQQGVITNYVENMDTLAESTQKSVESAMSIFEEFDKGTETSLNHIFEVLQSNVDGVKEWESNLQVLADSGVDQRIIQQLSDAGPEAGYSYVQAMAQSIREAGSSDETGSAVSGLVSEINTKFGEYFSAQDTSVFSESIANAIGANNPEIMAAANELGINVTEGLAEGLRGAISTATDAVNEVDEAVIDEADEDFDINSPSKVFEEKGRYIDEGLALGISGGRGKVITSMNTLSNAANMAFYSNALVSRAQNIGAMISAGLARGILSGTSSVINAANSTAAAAITAAQTTLQVHSPSKKFEWLGEMSGKGYAKGLQGSLDNISGTLNKGFNSVISSAGDSISNTNNVSITVNTSSGNGEDIANIVMKKIQRQLNNKGAAFA